MGLFFNRRKKEEENKTQIIFDFGPTKCKHQYKDFPWYMETEYNGVKQTASYKIVEPYVCILCGDRLDKLLEANTWDNISSDIRKEYYDKVREKYKEYLKPRAIVEDMINNVLLVKDPNALRTIEKFRGSPHIDCGTSAKMPEKETFYRINVRKNNE